MMQQQGMMPHPNGMQGSVMQQGMMQAGVMQAPIVQQGLSQAGMDGDIKRNMSGGYQNMGMYHPNQNGQMRFAQRQRNLGMQGNGYIPGNQDVPENDYGSQPNSHANNSQHSTGMLSGLNGYQQRLNSSIPEEDLYASAVHGSNQFNMYGNVVAGNDQSVAYYAEHQFEQNVEYPKLTSHPSAIHDLHGHNSSPVNQTSIAADDSLKQDVNHSSPIRRTKAFGNMLDYRSEQAKPRQDSSPGSSKWTSGGPVEEAAPADQIAESFSAMGKPDLGTASSMRSANAISAMHNSQAAPDRPATESSNARQDDTRSGDTAHGRQPQSFNPASSYYTTLPNGVTILSTIHSPDGDENEEHHSDDETVFGSSAERFQGLSVSNEDDDESNFEEEHENKEADSGRSMGGGMKRLNRTDSHEFLTSAASGRVNMSNAFLIKGRRWGGSTENLRRLTSGMSPANSFENLAMLNRNSAGPSKLGGPSHESLHHALLRKSVEEYQAPLGVSEEETDGSGVNGFSDGPTPPGGSSTSSEQSLAAGAVEDLDRHGLHMSDSTNSLRCLQPSESMTSLSGGIIDLNGLLRCGSQDNFLGAEDDLLMGLARNGSCDSLNSSALMGCNEVLAGRQAHTAHTMDNRWEW
uniref:Uncharacterized protein n=1 Tax=Hanusia phi TaxID=3032 RepID=A0A7S0F4Z6_9CRYP